MITTPRNTTELEDRNKSLQGGSVQVSAVQNRTGRTFGRRKLLASVCLMFAALIPICRATDRAPTKTPGQDELTELQQIHRILVGGADNEFTSGLAIKICEFCPKCIKKIKAKAKFEWENEHAELPPKHVFQCKKCKGTGQKMKDARDKSWSMKHPSVLSDSRPQVARPPGAAGRVGKGKRRQLTNRPNYFGARQWSEDSLPLALPTGLANGEYSRRDHPVRSNMKRTALSDNTVRQPGTSPAASDTSRSSNRRRWRPRSRRRPVKGRGRGRAGAEETEGPSGATILDLEDKRQAEAAPASPVPALARHPSGGEAGLASLEITNSQELKEVKIMLPTTQSGVTSFSPSRVTSALAPSPLGSASPSPRDSLSTFDDTPQPQVQICWKNGIARGRIPKTETAYIQVRMNAFSPEIKEFVLKKQDGSIRHFTLDNVLAINADDSAVLLNMTRKSTCSRGIPNCWFVATDPTTRMFLEYISDAKRYAFTTKVRAEERRNRNLLTRAIQANEPGLWN